MVRTQLKSTPEEKKDSHKKKSSSKKADTGIWPCNINGCNKEFAREADLKRHQRTTKLHSQPGFACPQCEATFTRTDALRRHQKSRHNGIIIEPNNRIVPQPAGEENVGETSRSRSRTPGSKGNVHQLTQVAPPPGPLPGYYRQKGINAEFIVFVPTRTEGVIMDPNYPVGHPTSAARLAQPPWGPPPWADGTYPVPPYPIPGPPPAYYAPYYHPGMPPLPPPLVNAQFHPNTPGHPYATPSNSPDDETGAPSDWEAETTTSPRSPQEGEVVHEPRLPESSVPVIDPSLEASDTYSNGKSPVSLAITSAAVQAVFGESRRIEKQRTESTGRGSRERSSHDFAISESAIVQAVTNADLSPSDTSPGGNPPSTMLTEDGETMLHPGEQISPSISMAYLHSYSRTHSRILAELLTQESLASPPPIEDD